MAESLSIEIVKTTKAKNKAFLQGFYTLLIELARQVTNTGYVKSVDYVTLELTQPKGV